VAPERITLTGDEEIRREKPQPREFAAASLWLVSHTVIFPPPSGSEVARVQRRGLGRDAEARKTSRRRSVMDNSRGMQPRSGWTWKVWVGIVVGLAVVAGLVVLIAANAGSGGGGSGGIY
jgi:hypothetical protein